MGGFRYRASGLGFKGFALRSSDTVFSPGIRTIGDCPISVLRSFTVGRGRENLHKGLFRGFGASYAVLRLMHLGFGPAYDVRVLGLRR